MSPESRERASRRFAEAIASPDEPPLSVAGIEHEYRAFDGDRLIDMRRFIHGLGLGDRGLDPTDPFAYPLPSGSKITCDQREAEVVTPPEPIVPGFAETLASAAGAAREALGIRLPDRWRLEGCSTHINVGGGSIDPVDLSWRFAQTFAPAMMLLMDGSGAPGLLVRPRPGRVELGGSFVEGPWLRASCVFAAGSLRALDRRSTRHRTIRVELEPNFMRFGWFVDRRAFGPDLYTEGRQASIELAAGGRIDAGSLLADAWETARDHMLGHAAQAEIDLVDRIVDGYIPLPCERVGPADRESEATSTTCAFGSILAPGRRPGFDVAPVMVTWDVVVLLLLSRWRRRRAFACLPRRSVEPFVRRLEDGALDDPIRSYLRARPNGRTLDTVDRATGPGLFDAIGSRAILLPPERGPLWDGSGSAPKIPVPPPASATMT